MRWHRHVTRVLMITSALRFTSLISSNKAGTVPPWIINETENKPVPAGVTLWPWQHVTVPEENFILRKINTEKSAAC